MGISAKVFENVVSGLGMTQFAKAKSEVFRGKLSSLGLPSCEGTLVAVSYRVSYHYTDIRLCFD